MGYISDRELARAAERITADYAAEEVIEQVFTNETDRSAFVEALQELSQNGCDIKVGGRRLRELTECTTTDLAPEIVGDAWFIDTNLYIHDKLRLGPLVDILMKYPQERMMQPDLDFFIWNANPEQIINTFQTKGFKASIHEATGGVMVIDIEGQNGIASFVNGETSWQTGEAWPMLGFLAKFDPQNASFKLDIGYGRLYIYPLEIPGIDRKDPINPQRVAAIGRALLWSLTTSTPRGRVPEIPLELSQHYFFETVGELPSLLRQIIKNPELESTYRSGIRDLALALRIIVLSDWEEIARMGGSVERSRFFQLLQGIWQSNLWANK